QLRLMYSGDNAKLTAPRIHLIAEELVGTYRTSLWTLFASVGMVFAIACANLANLVFARSASRQKDIAIRAALGARRGYLAWQVFIECVLLALLGALGGLALAWWVISGIARLAPIGLPRISEIAMDWEVFLFTAALSFLTASVLAVGPVLKASGGNVID